MECMGGNKVALQRKLEKSVDFFWFVRIGYGLNLCDSLKKIDAYVYDKKKNYIMPNFFSLLCLNYSPQFILFMRVCAFSGFVNNRSVDSKVLYLCFHYELHACLLAYVLVHTCCSDLEEVLFSFQKHD